MGHTNETQMKWARNMPSEPSVTQASSSLKDAFRPTRLLAEIGFLVQVLQVLDWRQMRKTNMERDSFQTFGRTVALERAIRIYNFRSALSRITSATKVKGALIDQAKVLAEY
jgi:hypothetical protein